MGSRFGLLCAAALMLLSPGAEAQRGGPAPRTGWVDKFKQLDEEWPAGSDTRTASGAPGKDYWQQRADYTIDVRLDDGQQRITGAQTVTYTNNAPDTLRYLWLNLDMNQLSKDSNYVAARRATGEARESYAGLRLTLALDESELGLKITAVRDAAGRPLPHTFVGTMMRIDLPTPLPPGGQVSFAVDWTAKLPDAATYGTRGGTEYFEEDKNYIYLVSQWFPRMAVYADTDGWQLRTFMSNSEFSLDFGTYDVAITVPADHIVAATGTLQNPNDVLSEEQRRRLDNARTAKKPVLVVTQREATANESSRARGTKTWRFRAENVRDFGWASSRKFIWDAQGYKDPENGHEVLAMSFYPKEANPLWEQYSTAALIHSLNVYGTYAFRYPYPTLQSVNGPVGGMEYPMLAFNGPRPEKDKKTGKITYSSRTKYALISVVIHEAGHNWFPMMVNSDERRWTWMDEGLNTFLQFTAERLWERDYPATRGEPKDIVDYMKRSTTRPIMTDGESLDDVGANAYGKPATALNILRETVLGREVFDFAFREYARRWQFKRATPADFFRTMEDASGVDLDWFWRGWFYSTETVDIALDNVREFTVDTKNPDVEQPLARQRAKAGPRSLTEERNAEQEMFIDTYPGLRDFYNENDQFTVTNADRNKYLSATRDLKDWEKDLLKTGGYIYVIDFRNVGGLVMPVIFELTFKDGSKEMVRIPAEVWRQDPQRFAKMIARKKQVVAVELDPRLETADVDTVNNHWPRRIVPSRLELFKQERPSRNLMKDMDEPLRSGGRDAEKDSEERSGGAARPSQPQPQPATPPQENAPAPPAGTPQEPAPAPTPAPAPPTPSPDTRAAPPPAGAGSTPPR